MNRFGRPIAFPLILSLTLITFCWLPQLSYSQSWPQFRGPQGNASSETQPPTEWSDDSNVVWKTELPVHGASSPIVVGDKIFLTGYSGYGIDPAQPGDQKDLQLHTQCFDRQSGKLIWDRAIAASPDEQKMGRRIADHGYASGTPCSDGESVFAFFGVSGCVAYDVEGNLKWHNSELGSNTAGFGSASSPVIHGDLVYVNASIEGNTLYALNKSTGEIVWQRPNVNKSWSSVCIATNADGGDELIINQKFTLFGLDPKTGQEFWRCKGIQDYIVPVPVSKEGVIYCLGGRSNRAMAIRLGGRGDVTETHRIWNVNVGANVTSPVWYDGYLYWASDKGIANCLNAKDGSTVYRERMPTKARVYASIVRGGQYLYLTTRDRGVWVLKANPKFQPVALNQFASDKQLFNASPAIDRGQLLLRNNDFLYCIGKTEPKP